jgi:streptogramin lyase
MSVISNSAGWLLVVLSLESKLTAVAAVFATSANPLLGVAPLSHSSTTAVTSTVRNTFAVPTGTAETTADPSAGAVWSVTVASFQAPATRSTLNDPSEDTLVTQSFRVALATPAAGVPAGSVERSNFSTARLVELTVTAAAPP